MTGPAVEAAEIADLPSVARLHGSGIREGFLSSLGQRFLTLFYGALYEDAASLLLVARREGKVVGFVAASDDPAGFADRFRRRKRSDVIRALLPALWRTRVARGLWELRAHVAGESVGEPELLAVVVDAGSRRSGIGKALEDGLEAAFRARGVDRYFVVVSEVNMGARAFYERSGFSEHSRIVVHRGTTSVRYEKSLL